MNEIRLFLSFSLNFIQFTNIKCNCLLQVISEEGPLSRMISSNNLYALVIALIIDIYKKC